jgi:hypothetical protein
VWEGFVGVGPAQDFDALGRKAIDLQALAQKQRRAAPVDGRIDDAQPYALIVRDGYLANGGVGRKRSADVLDADLPVRGRELVLHEGCKERTFLLGRLLREGRRCQDQHHQEGGDGPNQNACPMPT